MAKSSSAKARKSKTPDKETSRGGQGSQGDSAAPAPVSGKEKSAERKRGARSAILLILLVIIILLLLLFVADKAFDWGIFGGKGAGGGPGAGTEFVDIDSSGRGGALSLDSAGGAADSAARAAADAAADSLAMAASGRGGARLADSLARARSDSLAKAKAKADSLARALSDSLAKAMADSLARALSDSLAKAMADSLARARSDSLARADSLAHLVNPCAKDTLLPWVTPDPSGVLHRKSVDVRLIANKKCVIEWSFDGKGWRVYDGSPIKISSAITLFYRAVDSCGKKMDARSKLYEFDLTDRSWQCPPDMEYVKSGGGGFCVDVYEWPNRKGVVPQSYVSLYQATDSCFSARKRLCTSDEWTSACAGPKGWKYLYGDSYEGNVCAARDTAVQKSGSRPECRGYYAVFDMSGNLSEWTSTASPQDRSFNNVMGGFWASGTQSRCADARYSYFPQNRHNPVGFRCCRDASTRGDEPKGSGR